MTALVFVASFALGVATALEWQAPRDSRRRMLVAMALLTVAIALVTSPELALVDGALVFALVLSSDRLGRDKLAEILTETWPEVLAETRERVVNIGESLPSALFGAASGFPADIALRFQKAHEDFTLQGDLGHAFAQSFSSLSDPATTEILATVVLVARDGATEAAHTLEVMAKDATRRRSLAREVKSRLAGARLARLFILAVPLALMLAGVAVSGGIAGYLTPTGYALCTLAVCTTAGCWAWSARYLTPLGSAPVKAVRIPSWFSDLYFGGRPWAS